MRFAPAAAALSLALAVTSSVGWAGNDAPEPRAGVLIAKGETALAQGDTQGAIDAFEAALAVDPGHTPIFLRLAEAARVEPGNIRFEALTEKGGSVLLMAEYETPEAYDAHMQAPHTQAFRRALERIAEGSRATVTPLARLA